MTAITMFRDKKTKVLVGFEIKGHSGYAEAGSDIICAAVTTLAISVQNSIEQFCENVSFKQNAVQDGEMYYRLKSEPTHDTSLLLASAYLGFQQIAEQYTKFVTVKIKEV